jgi:hypothetical protein
MDRRARPLLIALAIGFALVACGPRGTSLPRRTATGILPDRIAGKGWIRAGDVERFAGDSLFEYIDGAAEMYHKYGFVEVTVGRYLKDEATITADIYLFEAPDGAFGMYTTLRPDEPDTVALGVEGFMLGPNLVFVKGSHLVNVYTYDEFEGDVAAVRSVAAALEARTPGTSEMPGVFGLFPSSGRVPFSEKIFAEGFLGYGFLTDVYTAEYARGKEPFRLFITPDPDGVKLRRWMEVAGGEPAPMPAWIEGVFEENEVLHAVHDYHGEVVAGRRGGKLLGAVGQVASDPGIFTGWVRSFDR